MNKPLGGIFPISGFMKNNDINLNPNQIETPIIIGHGKNDTVVPLEKSMEAYEVLKRKKANVELITYDAQHNIPIKMLTIISKTIKNKP
jgi:predicted esterase